MEKEQIIELYKTKEGRAEIIKEIILKDNFSIAEIVQFKEEAMRVKLSENSVLISGLAFRATTMFGDTPQDTLKNIEQVKPLVAEDILKSGVVRGTEFEKQLLAKYPSHETL